MENQPYHINSYSSGVSKDTDIEKTFAKDQGFYIDGHNVEPTSNDGRTFALNKIKGETLLYSNTTNLVGYTCKGSISVNTYNVEFWAPPSPSDPSVIRINGVIALSSTGLALLPDKKLQLDKNVSAAFSEVIMNDKVLTPCIFDVADMVNSLSSAPNKYFSAFDRELYEINLQSALDIMVFDELINVGGGGGLPTGHYQYQMRYASSEGDRTQWSHPTPMIPVVESLSSASDQYPWVRTYGGPPKPDFVTSFAPKLRFRVTNIYNYEYIEIKRIDYNAGAGIEYTSNGKIVARFNVSPGEISVREYIDPAQSNENIALSVEDETQQVAHVDKCDAIRYFDRRLVIGGPTVATKEADLQFLQINGKEGFPVIDKIGKAGFNDPYNHVYRKSEMRGEVVGYGAVLYDGVGNKGFVSQPQTLKAFQFPNRREVISADTLNFSFFGTAKAADVSANNVTQTHEVFDLTEPETKLNVCDFKNVIEKGRVTGSTGTKLAIVQGGVKWDCNETNEEIENHGADVTLGVCSVSYQPFTPVRASDENVEGHNYVTNTKVCDKNNTLGPIVAEPKGHTFDYRPPGFGPNYYAMGLMVAGITNFPKWAKSFAVVRTDSAKRVLCQGMGFYSMTKAKFKALGNAALGGKNLNKFWFYAPDIENGLLSAETINDIIDNPQNYKMQFVSPLGFFSEWYSGENNFIAGQRDRCIDMITYARLLRDHESDTTQQCNPSEQSNMGIPGSDGFNYITHDKWRNTGNIGPFFTSQTEKGNRLVDIAVVRRKAVGRGTYLELETVDDIYANGSTGGNPQFIDTGTRNLHEPVHIINIVRVGATIRDNDIQKYKQTTHYQKLESIIGKSSGLTGQKFELVDERWEDCIPALSPSFFGATTQRSIWIKNADGSVDQWLNVTFLNASQIATLTTNINNNASPFKGLYTHTNVDGLSRKFFINFDVGAFVPAQGSLIMVRYDNTAPIRVYGGDTYIGETIFAPIDSQASARDKSAETQFAFGVGLPFKDFKINPRYYTIRKAGASINEIQDKEWFTLGFIRQLCVMFTVESRSAVHLAHNLEGAGSPTQYFPLKNYIIRPNRWDVDKTVVDNHLYADYDDDYPGEKDIWKWGGFRFLQQINPDYSTEPPKAFFSKPEFGFTEVLYYPSREMHSLPRAINVQNAPGLKTFPANNAYDLDDNQGGIKYLWDATTEDGGENLYAFTNTGIALLLTKKSILSQADGNNNALIANDGFVKHHIWLNKEIGMFDEFWRGASEATVPVTLDGGSQVLKQAIFFPTKESIFRFMDNQLIDIGRINYHSKIYNEGLSLITAGTGTKMSSVFDRYKQQYYFHMSVGDTVKTFVFSQKNNCWFGTNDFTFDSFTASHNATYGHRDMKTYKLNDGYVINGAPVEARVTSAATPEAFWDKEFIRFRINSSVKPTRIDFYKQIGGTIQCSIVGTILKNYRGFEQYLSRIDSGVDPNRPRFQGRVVIFEIIHSDESEFSIIDSGVQFKRLKM